MLKLHFKTLFFILICCNLTAQDNQLEFFKKWRSPDGRNIDVYYMSDNRNLDDAPYIRTIGTPYINENFQQTTIYTTGGEVYEGLFMRFNAYHEIMEFKEFLTDHDSLIGFLNKTPDLILKIGDQEYDFVFHPKDTENGSYFEVLFRGLNVNLYKKTDKRFTEGRIARTSFEIDSPRRFLDRHSYFYLSPTGELIELKGSQARKLNAINLEKIELQKFIQLNKLNLNEEKDLIKLIVHLDTLL